MPKFRRYQRCKPKLQSRLLNQFDSCVLWGRHCSVICLCSDFKQVAKSILSTRNRSAVKQIFKIVASCLRLELISGGIHLGRIAAPNRIIAATEGQYKTLYWIGAETGMRPGELCGLAVSDLNLPNLTIRNWTQRLGRPASDSKNRERSAQPCHLATVGRAPQWLPLTME